MPVINTVTSTTDLPTGWRIDVTLSYTARFGYRRHFDLVDPAGTDVHSITVAAGDTDGKINAFADLVDIAHHTVDIIAAGQRPDPITDHPRDAGTASQSTTGGTTTMTTDTTATAGVTIIDDPRITDCPLELTLRASQTDPTLVSVERHVVRTPDPDAATLTRLAQLHAAIVPRMPAYASVNLLVRFEVDGEMYLRANDGGLRMTVAQFHQLDVDTLAFTLSRR